MASKWVLLTDAEQEMILAELPNTPLAKKVAKLKQRITVASAKGKGRNLQQKVCRDIAKLLGIVYNQSDEDCAIHSREIGLAGVDIILRGEARRKFPYSIECKNSESLDLVGTIKQAKNNEADGTHWLIVHKKKCLSNPIVILDWDVFLEAVKK